jgi:nicotinamidase-related amidase
VIDYQPSQFAGVRSIDRDLLLANIVSTVKTAKTFDLPIVHSTINVATGRGQPTVPELAELLEDNPPIDRTTTNAWEDADFLAAVRTTGRHMLILCALWTEICMAFLALDTLKRGLRRLPVVDAIGGTSEEAHRAGLERVVQAGGSPVSWVASPSSCSATGHARRQSPTSSKSSSPNACSRHERRRQTPRAGCSRGSQGAGVPPERGSGSRATDRRTAGLRPRAWLDELPPLNAFATLIFQVAGHRQRASWSSRSPGTTFPRLTDLTRPGWRPGLHVPHRAGRAGHYRSAPPPARCALQASPTGISGQPDRHR